MTGYVLDLHLAYPRRYSSSEHLSQPFHWNITLVDSELNTLTIVYSFLGPINVLSQSPRLNIQFWALIPTIAPKNSNFSLSSEEKNWGFDFLVVKIINSSDLHTWEHCQALLITVDDTSKPAMRH